MELFKLLFIISILGVIFGLIPLWFWFIQKRENTNRIKKVNIKKAMIVYYIMMSIAVLAFGVFLFLDIKYDITKKKPKIYTIPETKIETKSEYCYKKNNLYSKKYFFNNEDKPKLFEGRWMWPNVGEMSEPMIERTYTFYGLDGLGRGNHYSHEPTDLAPYVKNPFDNWYEKGYTVDEYGYFHTKNKDKDSQFNDNMLVDPSNHYIKLNYEGPKWLLEEDKDFFMDEVNCPSKELNHNRDNFINKTYYLHFNPKQGYITLYTQKHNTKENK